MDYGTFFARFKYLCLRSEKPQKELADEIGISSSAISRYWQKQVVPDMDNVFRIANYFNVSIDWLLGRNVINSGLTNEAKDVAAVYDTIEEPDKIIIQAVLNKYRKT